MDYKVYQITKKEMFRYAAVYILADVLISLLFYRSVLAAVVCTTACADYRHI